MYTKDESMKAIEKKKIKFTIKNFLRTVTHR